jgi:hypothetical protein
LVIPNSNDSNIVFRLREAFKQSDVPINYSYNIWESNKEKKYHSIKIVPPSKRKIVETETKLIPLTHMHMTSHYSGLVKINSFKSIY